MTSVYNVKGHLTCEVCEKRYPPRGERKLGLEMQDKAMWHAERTGHPVSLFIGKKRGWTIRPGYPEVE